MATQIFVSVRFEKTETWRCLVVAWLLFGVFFVIFCCHLLFFVAFGAFGVIIIRLLFWVAVTFWGVPVAFGVITVITFCY